MSVIPKEKQSAYQRWEMASLGEERPAQQSADQKKQQMEELQRLREQALQKGFQAGMEAGFQKGYEEGLEAARTQMDHEVARLAEVATSFRAEASQADDAVAQDMLDLALDLAKGMLKTALKVRPELVIPVVSEAIRYLPSLQQPALLALHPEDAELVRKYMDEELEKAGWRVVDDPYLERGGCRVETATNQIDATTQARWQRLAHALGKESDWLA